ncbi:MAG: hypothetical protein FWG20_07215, partial [Candidatus Cloacimonetes bacterium]|nr:hypothetical protein [Candidatus Cloacimonadota bacterium]
GKNSIIKIGSKIYPNTSIGPHCKVGGEVEDTIIQAYSNKQHDGFLGNSYIGEWVNIGAGTSNSDLKNNYNNVKMWDFTQQKKRETGLVFLGALIGDHCKLGINSTINTGTTICYGSSIYGKKLICGQTPPFSWVEDNKISLYDLEKLLDTIEKVKQRRGEKLSDIERNVMHKLYKEITKMEKKDD